MEMDGLYISIQIQNGNVFLVLLASMELVWRTMLDVAHIASYCGRSGLTHVSSGLHLGYTWVSSVSRLGSICASSELQLVSVGFMW